MKLSKEAKLGLIVTTGIVLLVWGLNYLKGKDFFSSEKVVYSIYDRVDGLSASNPVFVNGMKIGMIRGLKFLDDRGGKILVSMHITNRVHLPRNSTAEIFGTDILGSKGIRMIIGKSTEELQDGDTLFSGIENSLTEQVGAQVAPIKAKAENLLSSMDTVLLVLRDVFNENTKNNLRKSFESISHSMASIESITRNVDTVLAGQGKLRNIFDNIESITANLKNNNEKITAIINNFAAISDTIARANIAETFTNLKKTMEQTSGVMTKINKGEGTLGQLSKNDSLYDNLNSTARNLDLLIIDLKKNPGKYVKLSLF